MVFFFFPFGIWTFLFILAEVEAGEIDTFPKEASVWKHLPNGTVPRTISITLTPTGNY